MWLKIIKHAFSMFYTLIKHKVLTNYSTHRVLSSILEWNMMEQRFKKMGEKHNFLLGHNSVFLHFHKRIHGRSKLQQCAYCVKQEAKKKFMWGRATIYRRIFVYTFCLINICLSLSDDANKIKTLILKGQLTVLVFSENLRPIHQMVLEKFSSKNSEFYRGCTAH